MEIRPVGAELIHAEGHTDREGRQTDMKKLIGVFRQYAKAPKKEDTKRNKNETGYEEKHEKRQGWDTESMKKQS
jgi:hypothetical protein